MRRLTREQFEREYPRRAGIDVASGEGATIVLDRDSIFSGLAASVTVRSGVFAEIGGLIRSLTVEPSAIVYVTGLVEGTVRLRGALCVSDGLVSGSISGDSGAVIADLERNGF